MSNFPSLSLLQKNIQTLKQMQCIIMSKQMQQAIHLLQAPIMELLPLIELEMEQNPILEYSEEECEEEQSEEAVENEIVPEKELLFDEKNFELLRHLDEEFGNHSSGSEGEEVRSSIQQEKLQAFLESSIIEVPTLFRHLILQAQETFCCSEEISLAEVIIGNLDEFGFFTTPLEEMALLHKCSIKSLNDVLSTIKTFTPIGIGAFNLNESLLIQLRAYGKKETLAYQIVDKHFNDLLHNRIANIRKKLGCTAEEINETIAHIAKLDLHPGTQLSSKETPLAFPDVILHQEEETLRIVLNEDSIPRLRINKEYLKMLEKEEVDEETKKFIQQKIESAKWLFRNLLERNTTLERIATCLVHRQKEFFLNPNGRLTPLTMKTVAEELELNESTVARAVSNKYIETPRGLLPFRFFFTAGLSSNNGEEISANTVKELIKGFINQEDPHHPLSDESISHLIEHEGIKCARRTVAKYRVALKTGNAQQRRKFRTP